MIAPLATGFAAGKDSQAAEGVESVPQLRPTNISADGTIDFEDAKDVPKAAVAPADLLESGEVLFNNTNSAAWVGKSAVFSSDRPACCSNHVTRLRLRSGLSPRLVMESLNTLQRLDYFRWTATNFNNQAGVNGDVLREVAIPLGDPLTRDALLAELDAARAVRDAGLRAADTLLEGIDAFVLDALGLPLPPPHDPTRPFALRLGALQGGRLDPQARAPFGAPANPRGVPMREIGSLLASPLSVDTSGFEDDDIVPYLGLPECDLHEVREVANRRFADVRGRATARSGDILFARIEPSVFNRKYVLTDRIGDGGWAYLSTEFYPLRVDGGDDDQRYLYALLLSDLTQRQVRGKTTGTSGRRRLDRDMFNSILVPWPDPTARSEIAAEVARRRAEAKRLRTEARAGWDAARIRFEEALLGAAE